MLVYISQYTVVIGYIKCVNISAADAFPRINVNAFHYLSTIDLQDMSKAQKQIMKVLTINVSMQLLWNSSHYPFSF